MDSNDIKTAIEYARAIYGERFDKAGPIGKTMFINGLAAHFAAAKQTPQIKELHQGTKRPQVRKPSKAEKRLQSQELQDVKSKLIAAGIIVDGWKGTPAEFGCLVVELQAERGINNHGRRAWSAIAKWAEYNDNIESARSAIEKNPDTQGPTADKIRDICRYNM